MADRSVNYKNQIWIWDDYSNGVICVPKDYAQRTSKEHGTSSLTSSICGRKNIDAEIRVMDTVDTYTQAKFRKHYQRKVKVTEPAVATIQDIKDVAIFTCKIEDLSVEFLSYLHTRTMDKFLRSIIIYFQYYLQVWNEMQLKRVEAKRKLRQPIVTELENEVRDNLADLRSMVSRDYAALLLGLDDSHKFHHMSNKNNDSLSDKDRRLFEMLSFIAVKVTWIALFRKNLSLIEKELNSLLRTDCFNPVEHAKNPTSVATPEENRVLLGKAYHNERRLLHRSPAIQEIIFADHDYRMMAIGINDVSSDDERINYLEIAYAAPEELLVDAGIKVGILGVERKYLDAMLKPKEISTTVKRTSMMKIGEFKLPPKVKQREIKPTEIFNKKPSKYQETESTKRARETQLKMWRKYWDQGGIILDELMPVDSAPTLKTSIAPSRVDE